MNKLKETREVIYDASGKVSLVSMAYEQSDFKVGQRVRSIDDGTLGRVTGINRSQPDFIEVHNESTGEVEAWECDNTQPA